MEEDSTQEVRGNVAPFVRRRTGGWVKLMRSEDTRELLEKDPLAFVLLCYLALRARWHEGFNVHGLKFGEALAGDYAKMGLTRQEYRTRLHRLETWGFVTVQPTNRGNVVTLTSTTVFDISGGVVNLQTNLLSTRSQPAANQQLSTNEAGKQGKQEKSERQSSSPKAEGGNFDAAVIEGIYNAYPRKVKKVAALEAIAAALTKLAERPGLLDPAPWLLERVQAYAASPDGNRGGYTPHPATWFSTGRYDDDPAAWQRDKKPEGGARTGVNMDKPIGEHF